MAVVTTNLGTVTAYGDAVAAGYTGTKEQWQALMADYATVGTQAAQDAQTASTAATTATTAAQTATTKAGEASASATAAAASAASIGTPDTTLTQSGKAADAKAVGDELSTIKEELTQVVKTVKSTNLLNFDDPDFTSGYVNNSTGAIVGSGTYNTSGFIPVEAGETYVFTVTGATRSMRFICAYDSSKNVLPQSGSASSVTAYTVPSGVSYIRFSASVNYLSKDVNAVAFGKSGELYYPYFTPYEAVQNGVSIKPKTSITLKYKSLVNNVMNILTSIDYKKNLVLDFVGYFTETPTAVIVGHGTHESYGSYAKIDSTNITVYADSNDTVKATIAHGLTLSGFLHATVKQNEKSKAVIQVTTATGQYTTDEVDWASSHGQISAGVAGELTDCVFSAVFGDMQYDIYLFGDSYIGTYNLERYPFYLIQNGYTRFLADGYPGRNSTTALSSFYNIMKIGQPKFAIWTLGMNDGDTSEAINASWKTCADAFIAYCNANKITPILATIPNTPNIIHTFKNAYVKSSGYRYVDFAKAVGAETEGATWYTGLLNADNVHPTALGAKVLYTRFLTDVPEIMCSC